MVYKMRATQSLGGTWEWQNVGDVGKGEERWLTSLEEEEIIEEEADER